MPKIITEEVWNSGDFKITLNQATGVIIMTNKRTGESINVGKSVINKDVTKKSTLTPGLPYLIAIVIMIMLGVLGVILIAALRPEDDIVVVGGLVFGFVTPATVSILTFIKAEEAKFESEAAKAQAQETHALVNSRMEQAIKDAARAAYGDGVKDGRESANQRTDDLHTKKIDEQSKQSGVLPVVINKETE